MNQAIKIIQDRIEGIKRTNKILGGSDIGTSQIIVLEEIIDEISSLPSLDIDSLQRYSCGIDEWYQPNMNEGEEGDWIKYDDLKDLLRN